MPPRQTQNTTKADYKQILASARYFTKNGEDVEILPNLHSPRNRQDAQVLLGHILQNQRSDLQSYCTHKKNANHPPPHTSPP